MTVDVNAPKHERGTAKAGEKRGPHIMTRSGCTHAACLCHKIGELHSQRPKTKDQRNKCLVGLENGVNSERHPAGIDEIRWDRRYHEKRIMGQKTFGS
jgi:hypothetical protein